MFTCDRATALHAKLLEFYASGKVACALCHGVSLLRWLTLPNGEALVQGRTVTGFANVEEDYADEAAWELGLMPRDVHVMPWRVEDELRALGANYVRSGRWRGFAVRGGNLITGQQNCSGADTAAAVLEAVGR